MNTNIFQKVNFDFAVYNNEYYDMIEPSFDAVGDIIFMNLTRARIQGVETNITTPMIIDNLMINIGYNFYGQKI